MINSPEKMNFFNLKKVLCKGRHLVCMAALGMSFVACGLNQKQDKLMHQKSASEILGNPEYPAISYGGYRGLVRQQQPTIAQLKEDLMIMHAMGIRLLRTYNMQFPHATNVVKAIDELQKSDPNFEMYVMLGAWIDCEGAWTPSPDHNQENYPANKGEIERAVALTQEYPHIIKVIAVGNEAMVHWAASYFVAPKVILGWVNHLQDLKNKGLLPSDLWITSSDNFASWGGGGPEYHNEDLNALIRAVDYLSIHTYPFHDTHYNPTFWHEAFNQTELSTAPSDQGESKTKAELKFSASKKLMDNALAYSQAQFAQVAAYLKSIGVEKPMHIGETGWASSSDGLYGPQGSKAADEYKQAEYYNAMRTWTRKANISCFFFEAFDEPWKSSANPADSENHFGLFTAEGQAKYALWSLVDQGVFNGLTRDGRPIEKTYGGAIDSLLEDLLIIGLEPQSISTE